MSTTTFIDAAGVAGMLNCDTDRIERMAAADKFFPFIIRDGVKQWDAELIRDWINHGCLPITTDTFTCRYAPFTPIQREVAV